MASSVDFQEFKLSHHAIFTDSSDLQAFEDFLGGMELPTPPLSPDHVDTPNSSQLESPHSDLDIGETILQEMMASEDLIFDSQSSYGSDSSDVIDMDPSILTENPQALLQDCMWNCDAYEPRHSIGNNGIYTPAPSPPPKIQGKNEEDDEEEELSSTQPNNQVINSTEMFMYSAKTREFGTRPSRKLLSRESQKSSFGYRKNTPGISNGSSRVHPQAVTSESEEEIDVVTISTIDRPEKLPTNRSRMNTRKRTSSVSAPCSRHVSPTRLPPAKKRKCHSKRTHRLSSAGSNFGDGTESDDEQRRASHNILERKRRNDLKYSFQVLRGQIPELEDNQRAPKVTILRKAAEYIKQIREKEDNMQSRLAEEQRREYKLLQRLAYLKSIP